MPLGNWPRFGCECAARPRGSPRVGGLLIGGGPSAVARLVVPEGIDPIKRAPLGARAHVGQEALERGLPAFTDAHPEVVVLPARSAPLTHGRPRSIGGRAAHAVAVIGRQGMGPLTLDRAGTHRTDLLPVLGGLDVSLTWHDLSLMPLPRSYHKWIRSGQRPSRTGTGCSCPCSGSARSAATADHPAAR